MIFLYHTFDFSADAEDVNNPYSLVSASRIIALKATKVMAKIKDS